MKRILIACTVMALAACSGKDENGDGIADGVVSPNSVSQVAPSTPVGTVSGQVLKLDKSPLDGVKVTLIVGDQTLTANTNASGAYSFTKVPAGAQASLTFEKAGYVTARAGGTVPSSAGNFPINNGNLNGGQIALAALTSTARFRVITADGAPATGATGTLEFTGGAFQFGVGAGPNAYFSAKATVGADGLLVFSNVPEFEHLAALVNANNYNLVSMAISPFDTTGDGVPDWRGAVASWPLSSYVTSVPVPLVTLESAVHETSLAIEATNIGSLNNTNLTPFGNALTNSQPIFVTFNQPINTEASALRVKVVQEDCETDVPASAVAISPWTIQITANAGWTLGSKYNIAIHATGVESGHSETFIGYAFGLDAAQPKNISSIRVEVEKPTGASSGTVDMPVTNSGQKMWLFFDVPMRNTGSSEAKIQFSVDTDGNMANLEGCGETGNKFAQGYRIAIDEATSATDNTGRPSNTFACKASGYSSRWLVYVDGSGDCAGPAVASIPSSATTKILFPKTAGAASTYQSITGASAPTELSTNSAMTINILVAP